MNRADVDICRAPPRWITRTDRLLGALCPYPASLFFEPDDQIGVSDIAGYALEGLEQSGELLSWGKTFVYLNVALAAADLVKAWHAPVDPPDLVELYEERYGDATACWEPACVEERIAKLRKELEEKSKEGKNKKKETIVYRSVGANPQSKRFGKSSTERDYGEDAAGLQ